jgi:hypothetical protein
MSATSAHHLLFVEYRVLSAARFVTATPALDVSRAWKADLILFDPTTPASHMNTLLSGMPGRRLPTCPGDVLVFLDDAPVLDERQVMHARCLFRLATPGPRRKPHGLGTLRGSLLDVANYGIRSPEDHDHVHGSSKIIEARKRRQSGYRGTIRTNRNDVESRAMEIGDHLMTVPRGPGTGAHDGDCPRRAQQTLDHALFTRDVSHDRERCNPMDYLADMNSFRDGICREGRVPFHRSFPIVEL